MTEAETTQADEAQQDAQQADRLQTRKKLLARLAIFVVAIGIVWGLWYLLVGQNQTSTDNAYVQAEVAQVTPLLSAKVMAVKVSDTQAVKKGDVLIELDRNPALIAVAAAEADLAAARRRFRQMVANNGALSAQVAMRGADIAQARAKVDAASADVDKARGDLQRRENLAGSGAISDEELSSARKVYASARAALTVAQAAVLQSQSGREAATGQLAANDVLVRGSREDTDPGVLAAQARLDSARIDLENTVLRAPIDGVITRRQVQVGQHVARGVPIMTIVPVGAVYVEANFKERQLRRLRVGMPAEVVADIYGSDVVFHGKVAGIAGGTGSSMAIIPAQNATGNWIKVVQRVPVRITLDPRELKDHPLLIGLSTEVTVDLSSAD